MEKWLEDIQMAIDLAEKSSGPSAEVLASSPPDNSEWPTQDGGGSILTAFKTPSWAGLSSTVHTGV